MQSHDTRSAVKLGPGFVSWQHDMNAREHGRALQREREQHERHADDHVDHEVVGGRHHGERHRRGHRTANARSAQWRVAWNTTIPTARFQPAWKLGIAAYWFTSAGGRIWR